MRETRLARQCGRPPEPPWDDVEDRVAGDVADEYVPALLGCEGSAALVQREGAGGGVMAFSDLRTGALGREVASTPLAGGAVLPLANSLAVAVFCPAVCSALVGEADVTLEFTN